MITRELEEPVESKFYWSESTAVLKYIQNVKKLCRHEENSRNPADEASPLKGHKLSGEHR